MDIKLFAGVITLAILSSNSFANQLKDPRIISHKEYTTSDVILTVQDFAQNESSSDISAKPTFTLPGAKKLVRSETLFNVYMHDTTVKLGENSTLQGISSTYIDNQSATPKRYTLHSIICADYGHIACASTVDVIELQANDYFEFTKKLSMTYNYKNRNDVHPFIAISLVKDNDEDSMYAAKADGRVEFAE